MRIKVPSEFHIGGATYSVVSEELHDHKLYGQTVHSKRLCKIDPNVPKEQVRETFLHESLHVIDEIYDNHLTEAQISRLAHGLDELVQQLEEDNVDTKASK